MINGWCLYLHLLSTLSSKIRPAGGSFEKLPDPDLERAENTTDEKEEEETDDEGGYITGRASDLWDEVCICKHNRTYTDYGRHVSLLPNDKRYQELENIVHFTKTGELKGYLTRVPITAGMKVLDVGTGTGIWAMQCKLNCRVL